MENLAREKEKEEGWDAYRTHIKGACIFTDYISQSISKYRLNHMDLNIR